MVSLWTDVSNLADRFEVFHRTELAMWRNAIAAVWYQKKIKGMFAVQLYCFFLGPHFFLACFPCNNEVNGFFFCIAFFQTGTYVRV